MSDTNLNITKISEMLTLTGSIAKNKELNYIMSLSSPEKKRVNIIDITNYTNKLVYDIQLFASNILRITSNTKLHLINNCKIEVEKIDKDNSYKISYNYRAKKYSIYTTKHKVQMIYEEILLKLKKDYIITYIGEYLNNAEISKNYCFYVSAVDYDYIFCNCDPLICGFICNYPKNEITSNTIKIKKLLYNIMLYSEFINNHHIYDIEFPIDFLLYNKNINYDDKYMQSSNNVFLNKKILTEININEIPHRYKCNTLINRCLFVYGFILASIINNNCVVSLQYNLYCYKITCEYDIINNNTGIIQLLRSIGFLVTIDNKILYIYTYYSIHTYEFIYYPLYYRNYTPLKKDFLSYTTNIVNSFNEIKLENTLDRIVMSDYTVIGESS